MNHSKLLHKRFYLFSTEKLSLCFDSSLSCIQVDPLLISHTHGVTRTTNQSCTSMLSALPHTMSVQDLPNRLHQLPAFLCNHHSSQEETTSPHMCPRHALPPAPPLPSRPSQLCGPPASQQRVHQPESHCFCLHRSVLYPQKALQCPLLSKLSMTAPKKCTATFTVTSPQYIFDCVSVCIPNIVMFFV